MGFWKRLSGTTPERRERKGDTLFHKGEYGYAKMEYEAALELIERQGTGDVGSGHRVRDKILHSSEALALMRKKEADEMFDSEYYEAAEEAYLLTLELTRDPKLKEAIRSRLRHFGNRQGHDDPEPLPGVRSEDEPLPPHPHTDEYFTALCSALPDHMSRAYQTYGEAFRVGYIALNEGDFALASEALERAAEESPGEDTFIPLEIGTAYLNLERYEQAIAVVEQFLAHHPDSLHGYRVLCECLWATGAFDETHEALVSAPEPLRDSLPVQLLHGETFFRAGRYEDAESCYRALIAEHGRDQSILRPLALTHEARDDRREARELYGELMGGARMSGRAPDPFVKARFADLSLDAGDTSTAVLELYLSLVQEDPAHLGHYYEQIIRIYTDRGDEQEARRFRAVADGLGETRDDI